AQIAKPPGVLPGCDVDAGRTVVAHQPQPLAVIRADRLLEVAHAELGVALSPPERLLAGEGAVGVHEQLDLVADLLAGFTQAGRVLLGLAPDLDLHARDAEL